MGKKILDPLPPQPERGCSSFPDSAGRRLLTVARPAAPSRPAPQSTLLPQPLHSTLLYCTLLHRTALHCTAPHYTASHRTALHCTALIFRSESPGPARRPRVNKSSFLRGRAEGRWPEEARDVGQEEEEEGGRRRRRGGGGLCRAGRVRSALPVRSTSRDLD